MKTSPAGRALIKRFEGFSATAYRDAVGIWTIGYGYAMPTGKPILGPVTEDQADALLMEALEKVEAGIAAAVKVPLAQHEFDALASFAYNLGIGNLRKSTLLRKLNSGDRTGAAAEFIRWNRAGGQVLAGLTKRRRAETLLFSAGIYPR